MTVHRHRVCLVDPVDLICSLYSWWEGFGSSSLATLPWVSIVVLFSPLNVDRPLEFVPEAAPKDWLCPFEGQVWSWHSCLDCRDSGSTRYSGELVTRQQEI